jgi:hypothetical protein
VSPVYESFDVPPISGSPIVREDPLRFRQEWARIVFVVGLLVIFAAVIGTAIAATFDATRWPYTEKLLGLVLAPVSGLVGTALGFYFRRL